MIILSAYLLDSLMGDPQGYPHPVRVMGRMEELMERFARERVKGSQAEAKAGIAITAAITVGSWLVARLLSMGPAGAVIESLLMYTSLARVDLERTSLKVAESLERGNLDQARNSLRALVGRDVEVLDEKEITAAVVESVAENFVDGVFSPLFWGALGGAPAAMAFKAISTLDSMMGYRDERYLHMGRCAARADDCANYLPARISIGLIACAALLCGYRSGDSLRVALRDRLNHPSPNSGHPEAAFAGALGIKLGGPHFYKGHRRDLPFIGEERRGLEPGHIREAVRLMNIASLLALLLAVVVAAREGK